MCVGVGVCLFVYAQQAPFYHSIWYIIVNTKHVLLTAIPNLLVGYVPAQVLLEQSSSTIASF